MDWVARELPVVVLKSVECVKKNQRELSAALLALFSDVGKCFDDAKGSVLSTAECLLRNSMARMINTVSTAHKIIDCLGYGRNGRLCVSVSNVKDEQCPLLVGV
ncbi:hypothetical protein ONE63_002402 [Megalurothrips usitatus]|uniref:Uncharacterized protein n=1 Tax=Megalurothrips usitatus TaxID=439358 RepID=A0AAV7XBT5_9NEOP|nr:hypothetical protein ONE63_002402 [Megalurothrips usitatus]